MPTQFNLKLKGVIMKRFLSLICAIVMMLSLIPFVISAEEQDETPDPNALTNIAPNGVGYSTSEKHSSWTPPSSLNNGKTNADDWHGWECLYPKVAPGQNTSEGFSGEYCGIKFLNQEYYEIHEIKINAGLHALCGGQNTKYTVMALIEGKWEEIGVFYDEDFKPQAYESYEDAMANDKSNYHIPSDYSFKLSEPVTTNNVRIHISEFGKNYPGGDILVFPYIYELELIGKRGETPDVVLPEDTEFSQNICYVSYVSATSSAKFRYPFLAIDGDVKSKTAWQPSSLEAGQALTVEFPKSYKITSFNVDFGEILVGAKPQEFDFVIEALVGGTWQKVADGHSYDSANKTCVTSYDITTVEATAVRLVFEDALEKAPLVYEFEAIIEGERSYKFLESRYSDMVKNSAAKGNVAVLGTPYASANFIPYSDLSYIIDGRSYAEAEVWFPGTMDLPVHCGVTLDREYTVNKIVIYVKEPKILGDDITTFDIKALQNGEYVTIAQGQSYDPRTGYITIYDLETPIKTTDIRIDFTRCGGTIPNVLELEVYSVERVVAPFDGYKLGTSAPEVEDFPEIKEESSNEESSSEITGETENPDKQDNGEKNGSNVSIIVGVSICFVVAVGCPVAVICFKKKKNK